MELESISIAETAPEDVVQFIKHLEENLDPSDEFDCTVLIETVEQGDAVLPGDEIPMGRLEEPERADIGVRVEIEFVDNSDCPSRKVSELAETFYGAENFALHSSFDGGAGEYEAFIFESY